MKRLLLVSVAVCVLGTALLVAQGIPAYQKVSGVSGNLNSVGSDTMNNMMTFWAESFRKLYPNVKVQIEGKGSGTAPPALIQGTSQLAPMSRAMNASEIDRFEAKYAHKPTQLRTSYDALAVWVNKDNPIKRLSLAQVEAVFGKNRNRGYKENVTTWGQLGLTGEWANRPISLYGRNSASGTYGFFKEHVLKNGDYKDTVKEQPGSASVVQGVTEDRYGIGYSGVGYRTSGVRAVPLSETATGAGVEGNETTVKNGTYPLWRFLYLYVNKTPGRQLDPLVGEFLKLIFSKEGQDVVVKDGYMSLSAEQCQQELAKVAK